MQLFTSGYWLNLVGPASIVKRRGLVKFLGFNLVAPVRVNPPTRCLSERRLHLYKRHELGFGPSHQIARVPEIHYNCWAPASATKLYRSLRPTTTMGSDPPKTHAGTPREPPQFPDEMRITIALNSCQPHLS